MNFTARRISLSASLDANDGTVVFRRAQVAQLHDAAAILERARGAAFSIVRHARKKARRLEVRSAAVRQARKRQADLEFATRARALEEAYRLAQSALTGQWEAALDRVLAAALVQVGATIPAAERLRIVCEQLSQAAGSMPVMHLRLCSADEARYRCADIGQPWPIEIDETLAPGCCRLATEHGEWALDFEALIASLGSALSTDGAPAVDKAACEGSRAAIAE